jgi:hypothetical protein
MPYLHWETDRQRENFAANIEKITEDWRDKKNEERKVKKEERQRRRQGLPRPPFQTAKEEEKGSICVCTRYLDNIFSNQAQGRKRGQRFAACFLRTSPQHKRPRSPIRLVLDIRKLPLWKQAKLRPMAQITEK